MYISNVIYILKYNGGRQMADLGNIVKLINFLNFLTGVKL